MRFAGQILGFLAVILLLLPVLTAQEEKKDKGNDAEKKELEKKDPEKKDPEKTEPEKKEEKKKEPVEEKLVYGSKLGPVKLVRVESGEFAIDVPVPDPMKIYALQMWSAQQMQSIATQQNPLQRANQMAQYQMQLAQKQMNETTKLQTVELKAAENMKVRVNFPPVQFDDQGNLKRWTTKQLIALRGKSKWPGYYPGEADLLKVGQVVEVYLAKTAQPTPTKGPKRKADLEAEVAPGTKPEVVLIVVLQEVYAK
jgi:FtsZ-interacting cell division protein ZipA